MYDLTIIIPFYKDSQIRKKNLDELCLILSQMGIFTIVIEAKKGINTFSFYEKELNRLYNLIKIDSDYIPKSNLINEGIKLCKTKYAAWHDCDVRLHPLAYQESYQLLKSGKKFVRPFNGTFINLIGYKYNGKFRSKGISWKSLHLDSVGGSLFFDIETFYRIGGMNENFKGWGFEDDELNFRIHRFGFKVEKLPYHCFHIDHPRSEGISSSGNPFYQDNKQEYEKIQTMKVEELFNYCNWLK